MLGILSSHWCSIEFGPGRDDCHSKHPIEPFSRYRRFRPLLFFCHSMYVELLYLKPSKWDRNSSTYHNKNTYQSIRILLIIKVSVLSHNSLSISGHFFWISKFLATSIKVYRRVTLYFQDFFICICLRTYILPLFDWTIHEWVSPITLQYLHKSELAPITFWQIQSLLII